MSLPLSDIVSINISQAAIAAPLASFGELLFLTDDSRDLGVISSGERIRKFGSLAEVQEAFKLLPHSDVIKCATAFYSQMPTPKDFTVGVMSIGSSAGSLVGGKHSDLEELKKITAGTFKISVDNAEYNVTTLDFSSANSLVDVATAITTKLKAATDASAKKVAKAISQDVACTYSGGKFTITSGTQGTSSSVGYASNDDVTHLTAKQLGLTQALATSSTAGTGAETVAQALGACANISNTFIAVVLHTKLRDSAEHISGASGAALWCEAAKKIFVNTTNDLNVLSGQTAQVESTEAHKLKNKALNKTITTFGRDPEEYPSASLFGRIATVNYEGDNTAITLKFKKLPTISALDLTTSQKKSMDELNVGGFMNFGGNLMYAESRMADNSWLDSVHGLMWLEDRIKKDVFNLLFGSNKVPYTDTGISMVIQKLIGALEQGVRNGLLAAGYTPEGEFLPTGYKITYKSVGEVSSADKGNRIYRGITFQCIGAGALHNVIINGTFSE